MQFTEEEKTEMDARNARVKMSMITEYGGGFAIGQRIRHINDKFGTGTITEFSGSGSENCWWIEFDNGAHCYVAPERLRSI